MLAIGLMSGTSLDGVDAALVEISGVDESTDVRLRSFDTLPMSQETRKRIERACDPEQSSSRLLCSLNFELGHLFSRAVEKVCSIAGVADSELAFVASHGQTVWHEPYPPEGWCAGTLQLGEPAVIAREHAVCVVSDFRKADMAAGGQGAPLVPFSEQILYGDPERNVVLLNLGGIGNVTVLPRGDASGIFAFDTGPGNMMIDAACERLFGVPFDRDGAIAGRGNVNEVLFGTLMSNQYLAKEPPKSTGREVFGVGAVDRLLASHSDLAPEDIVRTLTEFTSASVADACMRYVEPRVLGKIDRLVVGGGGAHNPVILGGIARRLPQTEVLTQEKLGFSSDAKEAVAFAILGNQTLHGRPSNVPTATGAAGPAVLGNITLPPQGWTHFLQACVKEA
jgi:anhydro-N-acetylmuramic acid kinase